MCSATIECGVKCQDNLLTCRKPILYQKHKIDQVSDPGRLIPREGIGMDFLRELLVSRQEGDSRWGNTGETEEFVSSDPFRFRDDRVSKPHVKIESSKKAIINMCFNMKTCATKGSSMQIGRLRTHAKDKPVIQVPAECILKQFTNSL